MKTTQEKEEFERAKERVLRIIRQNPGITARRLRRLTRLDSVWPHLKSLKKEGKIISIKRESGYCYYPVKQ